MKTIQTVARYFPAKCGGIQIHLSELMPLLKTYGVESKVAAAQDRSTADQYIYRDVEVFRYPVFPAPRAEPNHGARPHGQFEQFAHWLKAQTADIYHQHQWTPHCGLPHLRLAKHLGLKTVVSIRLPQPLCQRQTLMLAGETACDGRIDVVRCSTCCGVSPRLPAPLVQGLSHLPIMTSVVAGALLRRMGTTSGLTQRATASVLPPLSIPAYVKARQHGLRQMARYADRIVVMSQWVYDAIAINGIPREQLFLIKHGISESFIQERVTPSHPSDVLRIGFMGRWTPDKGIHVLVEAIKQLPSHCPVELVIHGLPQDRPYREAQLHRIGEDARIRVERELTRDELPQALAGFDVLAVPSQWLETGPVVVLEAHAHGIPVVGSDLGGIAEKVTHGVDGLLVPPSDATAWATAFLRLVQEPRLLDALRRGIQPVRTLQMEAEDTLALYKSLLAEGGAGLAQSGGPARVGRAKAVGANPARLALGCDRPEWG